MDAFPGRGVVLEFWLGIIMAGPEKALKMEETSTIPCSRLLRTVFIIQKKLRIINKKMVKIWRGLSTHNKLYYRLGLGSRVSVYTMKGLVSVWMLPMLCVCKLTSHGQIWKCEGIIQA